MPIDQDTAAKLHKRIGDIEGWLGDDAPYAFSDQRHLVENTPERAYWHYGYWAALRDVLRLSKVCPTAPDDNKGK
jgi:hypothetical protein